MVLLKSLWKIIDGNKSIIGLLGLNLLGLESAKDVFDPALIEAFQRIFEWLTAGAIAHHVGKGHLKKDHS